MDLVFNEKQTPIDDEKLNSLPQEVRDDFLTSINNVLFINRLISPERKHAKDLERDSEGRIKVDLTNPHILENMDYFRQAAIHYKKYGCYTNLRPNPNPNSEYMKWATEEIRRCWYGMVRPDDGEWIPGDLYFYWNYCPIIQTRVKEGSRKGDRIIDFPEPWDSTYFWAHYNYQAVYGGPFNDYRGGNHFFVIARRGVGKAHPYTEQVYTPEGLRNWGDLQVGDFVFGDDGKPTKITHIPFDGIIDTYKVTLRDGRTVLCSDEHLWNVMIHNRKGIHTLSTKKLLQIYKRERKKSDHNPNGVEYVCSIPKNGCVDFEYKQTQIDPYTFGLLLGDGTFRGTSFYLTMLPKDFNELREYIPYECTSQPADDMNHKIHINGLSCILKDYSLINKKSEDKFIPDEYKFNSRDVRLNILHGLIDTDGFVLKKHNCYYISTASKQLADDIVWISRSLGFNASVTVKNTKYFNKKTNQYVNCLPSWTVSIYSDCKLGKLERKTAEQYKSAYSKSRFDKTRIVNIEYVGKMQSKCITVSNDTGCYLIDDFVVTHNSYYLASNLAKVFILGESKDVSESVKGTIVAADKTYLIEDGTLNKFERYIDFLAENTEWPAQRLTGRLDDMYWEMGYRDNASPAKQGTGNVIVGLSVKDKPGKVRGKRAVRTYFEEVGSFPNLIDTYNTARYNAEEGDISFGTLGLIGTGGEKGQNFAGALEMIYNPRGYGFYPLPNVFDKTANGGEVVLFLGAYLNRKLHYDKNGNSDVTGALLEVLTERFNIKNTSTDPATLTQKKAELPITIQDCVMKVDGNFYPVADLNERLNQIAADTSVLRDVFVGKLNMVGGHVEFQPTDDKPIREFPHKDNKKEGAIEIYKMPEINKVTGKVFNNRYIAGIDTYDNDVANSVSLGSILVLDSFTDQIVCEYTGRPLFADDFYEVCRRICLFYNCKANYEQNKKGLYSYFSRTHSTYLLTETFQYLRDKDLVKGESFGNTAYGTTATQPIKNYARGLIRNWLLKPCIKYEHKDGEDIEISYPQLYNLKNVALIKELSMYDLENNFDRHDALAMLMLYREDVYRLNSGAPKARDDEEGDFTKDEFFQTFEKRKQPKNPKWLIE